MIVISVNALFLMQRERNGMAKAFYTDIWRDGEKESDKLFLYHYLVKRKRSGMQIGRELLRNIIIFIFRKIG